MHPTCGNAFLLRAKENPAGAGFSKVRPVRYRTGHTAMSWTLDGLDFVGLQALLALHDLDRHALAFLQRLEAGALDGTEVHEEVRAGFRGDEAEALGIVEPLDGAGLTIGHKLLLEKQMVGARCALCAPRLSSK